ncbi:pyridoxal phosphate-dependent transferase [Mycena leptocephala]|nr:pyridoxal phosphate-dependent transferase [Mycena leptocephala]
MPSTIVDIAPFLSPKSKLWKACGIRQLFHLESVPGMLSLLAGKPNPTTFPFESITMNLKPGLAGMPASTGDDNPFNITMKGEELNEALQYNATPGVARFINWLREFQTLIHRRVPDESWNVIVGPGSQDLIYKACTALIDDGDYVLVETPSYCGVLGFLAALPCSLVEVNADSQGLNPAHLESILSSWETRHPGKPYPKILYTNPTGSNPTGSYIPEHRKIEILRLAKKYNFLLLEDDPYALLYYGTKCQQARSYFALEPEVNGSGTSRSVLSSGMRLGYMTASPVLSRVVLLISGNTNLQPDPAHGVRTPVALGPRRFPRALCDIADFYRARRDAFERVARKHLTGLAEWTTPVAGMFIYMKLLVHPDRRDADTWELIAGKAVAKGVLAVPGTAFMPLGGPTPFVRVSFSVIEEENVDEACRRLREVILEARAEAEAASHTT